MRVPAACLAVFLVVWAVLGWKPLDPATWLLENLPTFVIVPLLVATFDRFRFSRRSYIQATAFLILHTLGSHYSYALVPLGELARDWLGLERNHYDRFVHFAFGALLFRPARELSFHRMRVAGVFAQLALSFSVIAFFAMAYELLEWGIARIVAPREGSAFLGTQGDEWDAQKDMALACAGALIAMVWEAPGLRRGACTRRAA